ncbi:cysteine hydrolase family protein [Shouchella patagoniensis]|uniref:cysteine hydrolase family protein n=1 Tax=Shouchella patagoniensis TaxID=228576 RepID=UPI00099590B6|nr:isochorismatase family cysteine hydrolase [Shouchella patagoniensis]
MNKQTVLLIIDMINPFDFKGAEQLYPLAYKCAEQVAKLKKHMQDKGYPVIYVNDNYGDWKSEFTQVYNHIVNAGLPGAPIAEILAPSEEEYSVLKPQFSGFFATPLDMLLKRMDAKTLIITGVVGNMCIEFTANDAYMLGYDLHIPKDGFASITEEEYDRSLDHFKTILKADVTPISTIIN